MELIINACMKLGADRNRLEAKVFGGGHVMKDTLSHTTVPASNVKFAKEFLATEGIPIVSMDVGGTEARKVLFYSDTGRTLLSRVQCNRHGDDPELAELKRRITDLTIPAVQAPKEPDITLF
jgi:chemotaxis protein CheD